MTSLCVFALVAVFAGAIGSSVAHAEEGVNPALVHTREQFSFVVRAPYQQTFPFFGAYEERKWATGFDPRFVFPSPPRDQQGMVFTTVQEGRSRVWVNTVLDAGTGHVQYVYCIADTMVVLIDIHLTNAGVAETRVDVVYERTALRTEANEHVVRMAQADAKLGPKWAEMIHEYFARTGSR